MTLLYATFNIPVPPHPTHPGVNLWSLMMFPTVSVYHNFPNAKPLNQVPTFECLDLENDAEWCPSKNKDIHGLKQNLRNNIFYMRPAERGKSKMPWTSDTEERTVLKELVGYTKYIQSIHATSGSFDPLVTVGEHYASCIQLLGKKTETNTQNIQDLILHKIPDKRTVGKKYDDVNSYLDLENVDILKSMCVTLHLQSFHHSSSEIQGSRIRYL